MIKHKKGEIYESKRSKGLHLRILSDRVPKSNTLHGEIVKRDLHAPWIIGTIGTEWNASMFSKLQKVQNHTNSILKIIMI